MPQHDHARLSFARPRRAPAAVVELVGRYLCLFRGDGAFGLVHFHPRYDRDAVEPRHAPAYGHLPPLDWIPHMLRRSGHDDAAIAALSDADLRLSNWQRRAPHAAINVLRMTQVNAAAGVSAETPPRRRRRRRPPRSSRSSHRARPLQAKSVVDLDLGDGRVEKASGISLYSRNALRLVAVGEESLRRALDAEIALQQ